MFSCEYCKILKNDYFEEDLQAADLLILAVDIRFEKEAVKQSEIEYCHVNIFML